MCHLRAIQRHSAQAECVREVAGHTQHGDIDCWQCSGDSLSASSPGGAATSKRWVGHISTAAGQRHGHHRNWHQISTEAPTATGTPQCPSLGLNWHRIPSYPAILIPAPCLDHSSLLGSRIVFGKANERPAGHGLLVAGAALPVQTFQLQGRVRPCHTHPWCPPLQEPSPILASSL